MGTRHAPPPHHPRHTKTITPLPPLSPPQRLKKKKQVRDRLRTLLLENIKREREGELIDRSLMKQSLAMLVDLGVEGTAVYEVSR